MKSSLGRVIFFSFNDCDVKFMGCLAVSDLREVKAGVNLKAVSMPLKNGL